VIEKLPRIFFILVESKPVLGIYLDNKTRKDFGVLQRFEFVGQ
jgi:hypothetical protein